MTSGFKRQTDLATAAHNETENSSKETNESNADSETLSSVENSQSEAPETKESDLDKEAIKWADKCEYRCKLVPCSSVVYSYADYNHHVRKNHRMTIEKYTNKYGHPMTKKKQFKCSVCDRSGN